MFIIKGVIILNYNYDRITGVAIKDFRNLGTIELDFRKSAIVCLKGGNEAGKSSVVIALKTLGSNLSSKQYKEYIRTGTDGWTVLITTEDGTSVYRKKTAAKQSFGIYKMIDGKRKLVWSIDKLDENAVPKEVQDIIGFTTEPETKELLNVRTYDDQMLFVETSGGSNYKVMYNALKIDTLTKAVKAGTVEAKAFKSEVDSCENSVETCKEQLRKIRTIDMEPLKKMQKRIEEERKAIELLEKAIEIKKDLDKIEQSLGVLKEVGELETIDTYLFNTVVSAYDSKRQIAELDKATATLEEVRGIKLIDTSMLDKFEAALQIKSQLKEMSVDVYADMDKCGVVDLALFDKLIQAKNCLTAYKSACDLSSIYKDSVSALDDSLYNKFCQAIELKGNIQTIAAEYDTCKAKVSELNTVLKNSGVKYSICPNCGEIVLHQEEHED